MFNQLVDWSVHMFSQSGRTVIPKMLYLNDRKHFSGRDEDATLGTVRMIPQRFRGRLTSSRDFMVGSRNH